MHFLWFKEKGSLIFAFINILLSNLMSRRIFFSFFTHTFRNILSNTLNQITKCNRNVRNDIYVKAHTYLFIKLHQFIFYNLFIQKFVFLFILFYFWHLLLAVNFWNEFIEIILRKRLEKYIRGVKNASLVLPVNFVT